MLPYYPRSRRNKGMEMVTLDKSSPLSSIPAELQLDIMSMLDYYDVLHLKATCRYYQHFINKDVLQKSREYQIERFAEMEPTITTGNAPCYTCLKLKSQSSFTLPRPNDPRRRCCIPCAFRANRYKPGCRIVFNGDSLVVCAACESFSKEPLGANLQFNTLCKDCNVEFKTALVFGVLLRFMQGSFAIMVFALACTGQAVPTTSVATKHSLRFILTIILVCSLLHSYLAF